MSFKLYIFEGCDGTGKTTAAKFLATVLSADYYHFDASTHLTTDQYFMRYLEPVIKSIKDGRPVIFDRCWLSEDIYCNVFHKIPTRKNSTCELFLRKLASRIIFCEPSQAVVLKNYEANEHNEMLRTKEQVIEVYSAYKNLKNRLFDNPLTPITLFDYTQQDILSIFL